MFQEIRHAVRMLARSPGFTAVAALSLALGIGANSALFSFHDAIMWRPLPVRDPGSVVTVTTDGLDDRGPNPFVSIPNYRDLRRTSRSLDGLVAYRSATVSFARSPQAARDMRMGMLVSDNFFDVLGVVPVLGRGFTPEEGRVPDRDAVVVLSYDFWKNTLGGDQSILGGVVVINGINFTVVGVAPERFTGMDAYIHSSFYVPVMMAERLNALPQDGRSPDQSRVAAGDNVLEDRGARSVVVKGRLRPEVSRQAAQAELTTLWSGLVQQYPEANRNRTVTVRTELQERRRGDPVNAMFISMMTALVGIVLVIACANVANLMLGRARSRSREIAIRLALGVSRMRLLRQLLSESAILALIGCALGLGFAYGGIRVLSSIAKARVQTELLLVVEPQLDGRVVLFSLLATVVSALLFGLAPAWQGLKTQLVPALKSSESGQTPRQRTIGRNVVVSMQVALSMVLLVAAGMLVDGLRTSRDLNPGFRTDHLIMMSTNTALMQYTPARTRGFYRDLVDRVRVLPGVVSASVTSFIPFDSAGREFVIPEGYQFPRGQQNAPVPSGVVDEQYFGTLKTEIVRGRAFTADDSEGSRRVAIVNEAFAGTYWPNQEPIGKRIQLNDSQGPWLEVVGVVKITKYLQIAEAPRPVLFQPFAQNPRAQMSLLVETTSADAASLAAPVRDVARDLDVNVPVFNLRSYSTVYEERAMGAQLMLMQVVSTMGLLGLTLALIGLYGLVAYSVARRTREIGIRMAMGAGKAEVLRMVLRQGLTLSMAGIVVGGIASVGVSRLLAAGMAGLGSPNVATYVIVPVTLVCLTMGASYFPARRAAAVDPLRALRYE
jgi:predicted permease